MASIFDPPQFNLTDYFNNWQFNFGNSSFMYGRTNHQGKREMFEDEHIATNHDGVFYICRCPYTKYYHDIQMLPDGELSNYLTELDEYKIIIDQKEPKDASEGKGLSRV